MTTTAQEVQTTQVYQVFITDGKITWFEIAGAEGGRARGFYSGLFGWTFEPLEDGGD